MKLIKFLKKKILLIIVVAFIFGTAGVFAGSSIASSSISYSRSSSINTVKKALDDLYVKVGNAKTMILPKPTLCNPNSCIVGTTAGYYNKVDTRNVFQAGLDWGMTKHTEKYDLTDPNTTDLTVYHSYKFVDASGIYNKGIQDGLSSAGDVIYATLSFGSSFQNRTWYTWTCPSNGTVRLLNYSGYVTNQCSDHTGKVAFYVGNTAVFDLQVLSSECGVSQVSNQSGSFACSAGQTVRGTVYVGDGIEQYSQVYGSANVVGIFQAS